MRPGAFVMLLRPTDGEDFEAWRGLGGLELGTTGGFDGVWAFCFLCWELRYDIFREAVLYFFPHVLRWQPILGM